MPELDLLELDQQIARAARVHRLWQSALRDGESAVACPPGASRAEQRTTLEELRSLEDGWLGDPLRRWVLRLLQEKSLAGEIAAVEEQFRIQRHAVSEPMRAELSLAELLERALRHATETRLWLDHYLRVCGGLASASGALWRRRAELAEELGHDFVDTLELPSDEMDKTAKSLLADSDDAYQSLALRELGELLVTTQASAASDGWPGKLTPRTVVDLVAAPDLFRGLRVRFARVPRALGPASYLRALTRLGGVWSEASAPSHLPFVLVSDPGHLREHTYGAAFGLLPLLPEFIKTRLGLSRGRARGHVRALAGAVLIESRALALRVLLRSPALRGTSPVGEAFERGTSRAFGFRLDAPLAGAIFRFRFDDAQRLSGLLLAASLQRHFIETHDEDWFRNPRAIDELRTQANSPAAATVAPQRLTQGAGDLLGLLRERL